MSDNEEDYNSIIEEDSTYSGTDSVIENREDTAEIITTDTSKNEIFKEKKMEGGKCTCPLPVV